LAAGTSETVIESRARKAPDTTQESLLPLLILGLAVLVAAGAVGVLLLHHDRGSGSGASVASRPPQLVSRAQLLKLESTVGHHVYWAGSKAGMSYELTVTPSGRVYIRYLPPHTAAGDKRSNFLTVGTYPSDHGYTDLERAAKADDVSSVRLEDGALMVVSAREPQHVYLAYRDQPYQVEIFDPSGDAARELALTGTIVPVR
jgi:hypothetical protein